MTDFNTSHQKIISDLLGTMGEERDKTRKLHCEGHIYELYINLLNNIQSLTSMDILAALQEIEKLERSIMGNNYRYTAADHYRDYRGEFPCRTSAIIIDILIKAIMGKENYSPGFYSASKSFILSRISLLDGGYYPEYYEKAINLLNAIDKKFS